MAAFSPLRGAALKLLLLSALLGCALTAAQPAPAPAAAANATTPSDYICSDPQLTTLCRIVKAAATGEGAEYIKSPTAIETVFAPTDEAFDKDGSAAAKQLKLQDFADIFTDAAAADRLLRALIVPNQALLSSAFKSGTKYTNLLKKDLEYSTAWFTDQVYISSDEQKAEIITKDIRAGQAVIHIVNRVPYPNL